MSEPSRRISYRNRESTGLVTAIPSRPLWSISSSALISRPASVTSRKASKVSLHTSQHHTPSLLFRVAWVDKTTLPATERCLVPIQLGDYKDELSCDVLPMNVAHILLGRPWLYDLDVTNHGRENTYVFKYKGKNIILTPAKPSGKDNRSKRRSSPQVLLT